MSWWAGTFTGPEEEPSDASDDHRKKGKEGISEDLSQLTESISKHWKGFSSFLVGEPSHKEVESMKQAESTKDEAPGSPSNLLMGLRHDFSEISGTVSSGITKLSSVLKVVAGEDLLPQGGNEPDKDNGAVPEIAPKDNVIAQEDHKLSGAKADLKDFTESVTSSLHLVADKILQAPQEEKEKQEAWGVTENVVSFAMDIASHPETWLDFPLEDSDGFEMSEAQAQHAEVLETVAPAIAAMREELCPRYMEVDRFWKVYFVLLMPHLSEELAQLLSSPQILKERKRLQEVLRKDGSSGPPPAATDTPELIPPQEMARTPGSSKPEKERVLNPEEAKLASKPEEDQSLEPGEKKVTKPEENRLVTKPEEDDVDEWLQDEEGVAAGTTGGEVTESFSDLEEEEPPKPKREEPKWVRLHRTGSSSATEDGSPVSLLPGSEGGNDWLTVDVDGSSAAS